MNEELLKQLGNGDIKSLARAISFIENEQPGYEKILRNIESKSTVPVIGITGPPGAGKSTIVDAMIGELITGDKKVAVICIDPSSPFNLGALLGDRIRMSSWYSHPNVFIRSMAARGSVGGLSPKIIEVTELMKAAGFDYILVETVGVGQSEIEIAGLANVTIVVLVPESGDEVQTMKAGLMEIADVFVVNKTDRPGADLYVKNLGGMMATSFARNNGVPIIKTIASEKKGIDELINTIKKLLAGLQTSERNLLLLTEKAWHLIMQRRMKNVNKEQLRSDIEKQQKQKNFNLYSFIDNLEKNV